MNQLHALRAHLHRIGRCAFIATLIAFTAAQAIAQNAPTELLQPSAPATTTEVLPAASQPALPDAPSTIERASLATPPHSNLMLTAPAQSGQSLQQPATKSTEHKVRPGWLVLAVVGCAGMALGGYVYTEAAKGAPIGGTILLVPGAAMAGFGFYNAFHSKN